MIRYTKISTNIIMKQKTDTYNKNNFVIPEGLKIDLDVGKPEIIVKIDRDKARMFGLSTYQIASTLRTAIFGKELSKFKIGEDEYPIQLRLNENYRNDISSLFPPMNHPLFLAAFRLLGSYSHKIHVVFIT